MTRFNGGQRRQAMSIAVVISFSLSAWLIWFIGSWEWLVGGGLGGLGRIFGGNLGFSPTFLGGADKLIASLVFTGEGREGDGIERLGGFGVDGELADNLVFADFNQIFSRELRSKFLG